MRDTDGRPIVRASATEEFPSRGGIGARKERETKEDGRYIIFYTFEEEESDGAEMGEEG